jgi:hypothetical protein
VVVHFIEYPIDFQILDQSNQVNGSTCYNPELSKIEEVLMEEFKFKSFINEAIDVHFDQEPLLEKRPGCPNGFTWRGNKYLIIEVINEWHDYHRRGRMARNMQPKHATLAEKRGSWGVGQDYYRVKIMTGEIFDIYFDRAPKDINSRKGSWFIYRELEESNNK